MAAPMHNVRVKLSFENLLNLDNIVPPKAFYLVDSKCLDTIADLEKDIVEKFSLKWLGCIDFYVEGCLLPKWESIQILREEDVLRLERNEDKETLKKKKHKETKQAGKIPKKSNEVKSVAVEHKKAVHVSSSSSSEEDEPARKVSKTPKPTTVQENAKDKIKLKSAVEKTQETSSDSSSESEEETNTKKKVDVPTVLNAVKDNTEVDNLVVNGLATNSADKPKRKRKRVRQKKNKNSTSTVANVVPVPIPNAVGDAMSYVSPAQKLSKGHHKFDNEEDESLCKVVVQEPVNNVSQSPAVSSPLVVTHSTPMQMEYESNQSIEQPPESDSNWKDAIMTLAERSLSYNPRGRQKNSLVAGAKVFSRENRYTHKKDANFSFSKAEQLSTVATNKSFVFKNDDAPSPVTQGNVTPAAVSKACSTDYSSMPTLHHPPSQGQVIAYKIYEMSDNYCPMVSDYKEAKVLSFDVALSQLQLEVIKGLKTKSQPGKFDITDVEENVSNIVTVTWSSLMEPRLVSV